MAKIYFKYGAMDAGKTTHLIQTAYNYRSKKMNPVVFKPTTDTRDTLDAKVMNRAGSEFPATLVDVNNHTAFVRLVGEVLKEGCNVILVDEVHFFPLEFIITFDEVVHMHNVPVLCYGLRNSFVNGGFPSTDYLLRHAGKLEEIKTICHCGDKATHNMLVINGKVVREAESSIFVGGGECYHSVCHKHFLLGDFPKD